MKILHWPRLISVSIIAIGLAVALGTHALSTVSSRTAPDLAVSLFSGNGSALEQLAFAEFAADMTDPEELQNSAEGAADRALAAVRAEPLTPKAHAILAIAAQEPDMRRDVLAAALQLNRRDITLQSAALQEALSANDYPAVITTLDQILRVHPERSQDFFPPLALALEDEETIPVFADLLDNSSPWHDRFLTFAVRQEAVIENLAQLRPLINPQNQTIDRSLIASLTRVGDLDGAATVYAAATGDAAEILETGRLDWASDFPPFDWRLVDDAGFRAQLSPDGSEMEFAVRPGRGGVIAARLLRAPDGPFAARIEHRISQTDQLRDIRLQFTCANAQAPYFDERFNRQGEAFEITAVPDDCEYHVIAINARAWSGRSALSGSIESIRISQ